MAVPSPLSIYLAKGQPLCRIRLLSTALFPSLGRNLPAKTQVALAVDEHDGKRDKQQHARHDDGVQAYALNTPVAQHGAKHKGKDHAKIQQAVFQKAAPVSDDVIVHVLQRVAQVADAHGRSDAVTVDLAEALDLHAAGKRGEAVGEQVVTATGDKAHAQQDDGFKEHRHLTPVDHAAKPLVYQIGKHNTHGKRHHREEVAPRKCPVALRDAHAHEQDVACLRVGENMVAPNVRIHVHKATGERQDDAQLNRLRYLFGTLHRRASSLLTTLSCVGGNIAAVHTVTH